VPPDDVSFAAPAPASPAAPSTASRRLRWRLACVAVTLPTLLLGVTASLLADRLAFLGWGVGVALVLLLVLRWSWPEPAPTLLAAALALLPLAVLLARLRAPLDAGYRAALWMLYDVRLARPASALGVAVALAVASAATATARRRRHARDASASPEAR
jgi:hypothetical protein